MRTFFCIFLLAILCAAAVFSTASTGLANPVTAQSTTNDFSDVDAYINETMRRLPIQGLALAIVHDDQVIYMRGYGTANTRGDPHTPQTPILMGSVSKSFTALAVQQLVANGKLNLDAPLQTYLPEFQLADQHAASTITIRHLLEHTSGISNQEGEEPYLYQTKTTFQQVLDRMARYRPPHQPGDQYEYSNVNYILLSEAIAHASGQLFPEYIQRNILEPLEMTSSTTADYHTLPQAATGNLIAFGFPIPYNEAHVPIMRGAHYLTSTAEDLTHYVIALFNQGSYHGRSVLPAHGAGWYDLIWNWYTHAPGDIPLSIMGGTNSINTNIQLFVPEKLGVVVLMNTRLDELSPAPTADTIAYDIGNIILGSPRESPSNQPFYTFWALVDGFLLVLIASILWQALKFKDWWLRYPAASRARRIVLWIVIVFDLLVCTGILALPSLASSRWTSLLGLRPDFAIPLLMIGLCLGGIGLCKVAKSIITARPQQNDHVR